MTKKRYCHACGQALGHVPEWEGVPNLTGSEYQHDKFDKHTKLESTGSYRGLVSVYDQCGYDAYKQYAMSTHASGAVEVTERPGRCDQVDIVWYVGPELGITTRDGQPVAPPDGVKLVLAHDEGKMHHFATRSLDLRFERCDECDGQLLADALRPPHQG